MILDFDSFVAEAKGAGILYHFTSLDALKQILEDNELKPGMFPCVSFTRNGSFQFYTRLVRITVDGDKLSERYRIKPSLYEPQTANYVDSPPMDIHSRRDMYGNEREECVCEPIKNIKKYLIEVDVIELKRPEHVEILRHIMSDNQDVTFKQVRKFTPARSPVSA